MDFFPFSIDLFAVFISFYLLVCLEFQWGGGRRELFSCYWLQHQTFFFFPVLIWPGVRINAINPTYVATRLSRDMVNMDAVIDAMGKLAERETPLQGQFSGPEEQAEVILFLASDSARMVHGQCIPVDGGIGLKGAPTNFPALMQGMFAPQK